VELRVHQCLHSQRENSKDVKRVYAHAQSLQQCKTWLRVNLPGAECIAVGSNAEGRAWRGTRMMPRRLPARRPARSMA
jgi:prephenate dehydratase